MKNNKLKRFINEAVDGGWEVPTHMAREAYDLACDCMGKESIDAQIIDALDTDELAACLAFIFRMNDFREWTEYMESQDEEEYEEEDDGLNEAARRAVKKFLNKGFRRMS